MNRINKDGRLILPWDLMVFLFVIIHHNSQWSSSSSCMCKVTCTSHILLTVLILATPERSLVCLYKWQLQSLLLVWPSPLELRTDEAQAAAQTFYEDLGALAVQKGWEKWTAKNVVGSQWPDCMITASWLKCLCIVIYSYCWMKPMDSLYVFVWGGWVWVDLSEEVQLYIRTPVYMYLPSQCDGVPSDHQGNRL